METTKPDKPSASASNVYNIATQRRAKLSKHSVPSKYHVFSEASDLSDIKVVILNGTLKRNHKQSNTFALTECVMGEFAKYDITSVQHFHLAKMNIVTGTEEIPQDPNDDMHSIYYNIKHADILVIATPFLWGGVSSLTQKVIERMNVFDQAFVKEGTSLLYGKTFGCIIADADHGVYQIYGQLIAWASLLGFTIAPRGLTYYIDAVGTEKKPVTAHHMASNSVTQQMTQTMVMNCVNTAYILRQAMSKNPV